MPTETQPLDLAWVCISAALVMVMQGGFCCVESGFVRSKNSINVAIKNLTDFCLAMTGFFLFGFAFMFGESQWGVFGFSHFMLGESPTPWLLSFFLFQATFCGTATTIVSGAIAERMRFVGYLCVAAIVSVVIYPLMGHWAWGGLFEGTSAGWLAKRGFIDFAGSTVVHGVGGWCALAAAIVVGPRLNRFSKDSGLTFQGHNLPLCVLGVMLLWFGWFGFNGGSGLVFDNTVPLILVNTCIAGAVGGVVGLLLSQLFGGTFDAAHGINGVISGLVSITASCHIVSPGAALGIGLVASAICYGATALLEARKIDDAVGAFAAHGCAGVWGTLAVALFADPDAFSSGYTRFDQFQVQLLGVSACFLWSFGFGYVAFALLNKFIPFRVSQEDEHLGLNITEHNASTELYELLKSIESYHDSSDDEKDGDAADESKEDAHTETAQIASIYSRLADSAERERETAELKVQLANNHRMESIGQLAAGIAHEINTPIQFVGDNTRFLEEAFADLQRLLDLLQSPGLEEADADVIRTQVQELLSEIDVDFLKDEVPEAIKQSLDGIEHMATIVGGMKTFSHPGANDLQPIDINKAIQNTLNIATSEWKYVADIELDLASDLPRVPCFQTEFNQVLLNVIVNAAQAMPDKFDRAKGCIRIATAVDGDFLTLTIEDNGPGMPADVRDRVFDPFFTTKPVGKGTGQGLAIAQATIVKRHKGTIDVSSEEGEGTTFVIRVPLQPTSNPEVASS